MAGFVKNPGLDISLKGEDNTKVVGGIYDPKGIQERFLISMLESGNIYPLGVRMLQKAFEELQNQNFFDLQTVHLSTSEQRENTEQIQNNVLKKLSEIGGENLILERHPEKNKNNQEIKINLQLIRRLYIAAYKQQALHIISGSHIYNLSQEEMIEKTRQELNKLGVTNKYIDGLIKKLKSENQNI